jgi:hypothetical protein
MRFIAITNALHASVGSLAISAAIFGLEADFICLLLSREDADEEEEGIVRAFELLLLDAVVVGGRANECGRSIAMHSMRDITCCVCGITNKREILPIDESNSNAM